MLLYSTSTIHREAVKKHVVALKEAWVGWGSFCKSPLTHAEDIANAPCFVPRARTHLSFCIPAICVAFGQVYMYLSQKEGRGSSQSGFLKVMATFVARGDVTSWWFPWYTSNHIKLYTLSICLSYASHFS